MTKPRVAILGLGVMGSGMAGRLLSEKFPLTVYNRNPEKAGAFAAAGALVARSPREASARSEIVLSMVSDDEASRAVWLGDQGALAGALPGAVLIESSTLTVGWIKELALAASARGLDLLDAPVTGTKPHAASGQLLFLVGGSTAALAKAREVFSVLGREATHLGPSGSGALLKLVNNFLCGVQAASLAEALALVRRSDLDPEKALAVLTNGAPGSPLIKTISERAAARNFTPNFLLRLMTKDLGYASEEGIRHGVRLQTAASALEVFRQAMAAGYGEMDFSAVLESLRPRPEG
jgi:3-hydroxyisobutyrate dehydrogenase